MSCGVGRGHGSDPALLWLWHRLAAVAPIRPLAWEPPYASGVALKRQKDKKKNVCKVTGSIRKGHGLDDSIYIKCLKEVNPWSQKVDHLLPGPGGRE